MFGIVGKERTNVYSKIYYGLFALQHRGQESAGIATSVSNANNVSNNAGNGIKIVKDMGIVPEALRNKFIEGNTGIGHVRYSTTGSSSIENSQPIQIKCNDEIFAIAHNGNIVNTIEIKQKLKGATFLTTTDSEVIANLIAHYYASNKNFLECLKQAMKEIVGSYCLVILYQNKVIAIRDPNGFRPLVIGKNEEGEICVASETCALDAIGFSYLRDVEPGEIFVAEYVYEKENDKISSSTYSVLKDKISHCMFEYVYFARAGEKELCTKLNPIKTEVEGKRIILIDDSIVRGTTIKRLIKILRDKGAKEVHIRVSCPPIKFPCNFGIDMQTAKEFIARDKSAGEIVSLIGADSLQYISIEGLFKAIGTKNLCDACLTGISPVSEKQMKLTDEIM
ncbi:MAG: amidophosphoribosyltransferase [Candidatus Altiarchaeales archaeon HGW-Altiarchaeales-1]|nr:MAG: amidophosphoribosyltransferase [Candidatus Altiarchaeales archaeon HGW-Altiarchaeales-1]